MVRWRNVTSLRDGAVPYLWELVAVTSLMGYVHTKPGYYIKLYCYYYYYYLLGGIYKYLPEIMNLGYLINVK